MGWSTTLLFATVASAHSYSSSSIGSGYSSTNEACAPDAGCIKNRICSFGSEENYKIARAALYKATGRPTTCNDQCSCTPSPTNEITTLLVRAQADQYIYGNNSVCNSHVLQAAMYYHTGGFACEKIFAEAQVDLIRLCGVQNGRSCYGKCTAQYQIDTPPPMCEEHTGIDENSMYAIFAYIILGCVLGSWTSGVEFKTKRGTLRDRFKSTHSRIHSVYGDTELDALLSGSRF